MKEQNFEFSLTYKCYSLCHTICFEGKYNLHLIYLIIYVWAEITDESITKIFVAPYLTLLSNTLFIVFEILDATKNQWQWQTWLIFWYMGSKICGRLAKYFYTGLFQIYHTDLICILKSLDHWLIAQLHVETGKSNAYSYLIVSNSFLFASFKFSTFALQCLFSTKTLPWFSPMSFQCTDKASFSWKSSLKSLLCPFPHKSHT